ncbi:MAG: hypothetical protein QG635_1658 [Bacteroidota bacterium]|nr:hypothetical protein [Bacteroidota bacterium]
MYVINIFKPYNKRTIGHLIKLSDIGYIFLKPEPIPYC